MFIGPAEREILEGMLTTIQSMNATFDSMKASCNRIIDICSKPCYKSSNAPVIPIGIAESYEIVSATRQVEKLSEKNAGDDIHQLEEEQVVRGNAGQDTVDSVAGSAEWKVDKSGLSSNTSVVVPSNLISEKYPNLIVARKAHVPCEIIFPKIGCSLMDVCPYDCLKADECTSGYSENSSYGEAMSVADTSVHVLKLEGKPLSSVMSSLSSVNEVVRLSTNNSVSDIDRFTVHINNGGSVPAIRQSNFSWEPGPFLLALQSGNYMSIASAMEATTGFVNNIDQSVTVGIPQHCGERASDIMKSSYQYNLVYKPVLKAFDAIGAFQTSVTIGTVQERSKRIITMPGHEGMRQSWTEQSSRNTKVAFHLFHMSDLHWIFYKKIETRRNHSVLELTHQFRMWLYCNRLPCSFTFQWIRILLVQLPPPLKGSLPRTWNMVIRCQHEPWFKTDLFELNIIVGASLIMLFYLVCHGYNVKQLHILLNAIGSLSKNASDKSVLGAAPTVSCGSTHLRQKVERILHLLQCFLCRASNPRMFFIVLEDAIHLTLIELIFSRFITPFAFKVKQLESVGGWSGSNYQLSTCLHGTNVGKELSNVIYLTLTTWMTDQLLNRIVFVASTTQIIALNRMECWDPILLASSSFVNFLHMNRIAACSCFLLHTGSPEYGGRLAVLPIFCLDPGIVHTFVNTNTLLERIFWSEFYGSNCWLFLLQQMCGVNALQGLSTFFTKWTQVDAIFKLAQSRTCICCTVATLGSLKFWHNGFTPWLHVSVASSCQISQQQKVLVKEDAHSVSLVDYMVFSHYRCLDSSGWPPHILGFSYQWSQCNTLYGCGYGLSGSNHLIFYGEGNAKFRIGMVHSLAKVLSDVIMSKANVIDISATCDQLAPNQTLSQPAFEQSAIHFKYVVMCPCGQRWAFYELYRHNYRVRSGMCFDPGGHSPSFGVTFAFLAFTMRYGLKYFTAFNAQVLNTDSSGTIDGEFITANLHKVERDDFLIIAVHQYLEYIWAKPNWSDVFFYAFSRDVFRLPIAPNEKCLTDVQRLSGHYIVLVSAYPRLPKIKQMWQHSLDNKELYKCLNTDVLTCAAAILDVFLETGCLMFLSWPLYMVGAMWLQTSHVLHPKQHSQLRNCNGLLHACCYSADVLYENAYLGSTVIGKAFVTWTFLQIFGHIVFGLDISTVGKTCTVTSLSYFLAATTLGAASHQKILQLHYLVQLSWTLVVHNIEAKRPDQLKKTCKMLVPIARPSLIFPITKGPFHFDP